MKIFLALSIFICCITTLRTKQSSYPGTSDGIKFWKVQTIFFFERKKKFIIKKK